MNLREFSRYNIYGPAGAIEPFDGSPTQKVYPSTDDTPSAFQCWGVSKMHNYTQVHLPQDLGMSGYPTVVTVSADASSSTSFSDWGGSCTFDLGDLLVGATLLGSVRYVRSNYGRAAFAAFHGILKPFLKEYTVRVDWELQHKQQPDDPIDGITFGLTVNIQGFSLATLYRLISTQEPADSCAEDPLVALE